MAGTSARPRSKAGASPPKWDEEYAELAARRTRTPLNTAELERLGMAAYLTGHEAEGVSALTEAHNLALEQREIVRAARFAFWIAFSLLDSGDRTQASGWLARARRLLDDEQVDCAERGYLVISQGREQAGRGDGIAAEASFRAAEEIGLRFGDFDLTCLARMGRGRSLFLLGRTAEGVALLDEVMVSVTAGELTPPIAGIVYAA